MSLHINDVFCPVDDNGVARHSCKKKLKLPFHKLKLGIQNISYVGPSTCNELPNNFKAKTSENCFQHDMKKYLLKKLSETEADIYSNV